MIPLDFESSSPLAAIGAAVYWLALSLIALYGIHRTIVVARYLRARRRGTAAAAAPPAADPLPRVTVQLPLYNEANVAARLLEHVGRLRYPWGLLEIQVLDDSTDETSAIVDAAAAKLQHAGLDVAVLRRGDRAGYKAGALAHGLDLAKGDVLLVLDADFMPPPDLLERTVAHFADPRVAVVQTRWGHANAERSLLTRTQALMLDGHFVVEHGSRSLAGLFFNFNGSGGLWRRAAIVESGGWQSDTLTEDLDLSYRAQICGWRFVYRPDIVVPAELPESVAAFKAQQHRWARGGAQTMRKLLGRVLRAKLPLRVKLEAAFHLTANVTYACIALMGLLLPVTLWRYAREPFALAFGFCIIIPGALGLALFYTVTGAALSRRGWWRGLARLPWLMALGVGISISQTHALIAGILAGPAEFVRTPKRGDRCEPDRYSARWSPLTVFEVAMALYAAATAAAVLAMGCVAALPLVALYMFSFGWVGSLSVRDHLRTRACREG